MKVLYYARDSRQLLGTEERPNADRLPLLQGCLDHDTIQTMGHSYRLYGAKVNREQSVLELLVIDDGYVYIEG
jgi:hypothetical protein